MIRDISFCAFPTTSRHSPTNLKIPPHLSIQNRELYRRSPPLQNALPIHLPGLPGTVRAVITSVPRHSKPRTFPPNPPSNIPHRVPPQRATMNTNRKPQTQIQFQIHQTDMQSSPDPHSNKIQLPHKPTRKHTPSLQIPSPKRRRQSHRCSIHHTRTPIHRNRNPHSENIQPNHRNLSALPHKQGTGSRAPDYESGQAGCRC